MSGRRPTLGACRFLNSLLRHGPWVRRRPASWGDLPYQLPYLILDAEALTQPPPSANALLYG